MDKNEKQDNLPTLNEGLDRFEKLLSNVKSLLRHALPYLTVIFVLCLGAFISHFIALAAGGMAGGACGNGWRCQATAQKAYQVAFLVGTALTLMFVFKHVRKGLEQNLPSSSRWTEFVARTIPTFFAGVVVGRIFGSALIGLGVIALLFYLFLVPKKSE